MRSRVHRQCCNTKVRHFNEHPTVFPSHANVARHINVHASTVKECAFRLRLGAKNRAVEIGSGIESESPGASKSVRTHSGDFDWQAQKKGSGHLVNVGLDSRSAKGSAVCLCVAAEAIVTLHRRPSIEVKRVAGKKTGRFGGVIHDGIAVGVRPTRIFRYKPSHLKVDLGSQTLLRHRRLYYQKEGCENTA